MRSNVSVGCDLSGHNSRKNRVQFLRLSVVDGHDESSATFEGNTNNDQSAFFDRFHWSVTGSGLHSSHVRYLFLEKRITIIPRSK